MKGFGKNSGLLLWEHAALLWGVIWFVLSSTQALCASLDGAAIMAEVFSRHTDYPYVFEAQTLILTDAQGHRETRKLRRFLRIEPDHTTKLLWVLDHPEEVKGVMVKIIRAPGQKAREELFLPALSRGFSPGWGKASQGLMGTEFSPEEFMKAPGDLIYERKKDQVIKRVPYFIVQARSRGLKEDLRIHFIRKDIFFITRTDFYTLDGRLIKRMTRHDLKRADKQMWQAGMVLMENIQTGSRTLIKTDRRIFSRDYVPECLFTRNWTDLGDYLFNTRKPNSRSGGSKIIGNEDDGMRGAAPKWDGGPAPQTETQ